jgi:citrate lyase beta subunit
MKKYEISMMWVIINAAFALLMAAQIAAGGSVLAFIALGMNIFAAGINLRNYFVFKAEDF